MTEKVSSNMASVASYDFTFYKNAKNNIMRLFLRFSNMVNVDVV